MNFITLLPAYGRDYKSKKVIIDDLNNNKDFLESTTRKYINKEQFKELNISSFNVRYDQQRKITNIKIGDLKK
jgi:benzoyl-CoA reductase/2-hydroxyglutaryl-CoA dehydratase subunit BcrC/BadD/HgdB